MVADVDVSEECGAYTIHQYQGLSLHAAHTRKGLTPSRADVSVYTADVSVYGHERVVFYSSDLGLARSTALSGHIRLGYNERATIQSSAHSCSHHVILDEIRPLSAFLSQTTLFVVVNGTFALESEY